MPTRQPAMRTTKEGRVAVRPRRRRRARSPRRTARPRASPRRGGGGGGFVEREEEAEQCTQQRTESHPAQSSLEDRPRAPPRYARHSEARAPGGDGEQAAEQGHTDSE